MSDDQGLWPRSLIWSRGDIDGVQGRSVDPMAASLTAYRSGPVGVCRLPGCEGKPKTESISPRRRSRCARPRYTPTSRPCTRATPPWRMRKRLESVRGVQSAASDVVASAGTLNISIVPKACAPETDVNGAIDPDPTGTL